MVDETSQPSQEDIARLNEMIQRVQSGGVLSDDELNFVLGNIQDEHKPILQVLNKRNKGEQLNAQEQAFFEQLQRQQQGSGQLPISPESQINKDYFERERKGNKGGFEIHQLTDLHQKAENFEEMLKRSLFDAGHLETDDSGRIVVTGRNFSLKKNVPIALTGDLGTDFFDTNNLGLEAFLSDALVDKGGWDSDEEKEFRSLYESLMKMAGLDENMILEQNQSAFAEGGSFAMFQSYLFGIQEPHFLTNAERKEFRSKKERLQNLLKKGMKNHARKEYTIIKKSLERMGLTPNEVAIVSGNHDLPEVMREVLGDYLIMPGQVRNVAGVKFGNVVDSANGNFTGGSDFNDVFGYAGLRESLDKVRYESEPFKKIKSILNDDLGLDFDDDTIKKYMDISVQRAAQGIGAGHLGSYFKSEIEPILQKHVKSRIEGLKANIPKDADVILQHSMIDHPQRAGLEEMAAHELISQQLGPGTIVLHGHEHSPTPHRKDNVIHLNPGSASGGNSAVHVFDRDKKYVSSLFKGIDDNMIETYKYLNMYNVPGHPSGRYKGQ